MSYMRAPWYAYRTGGGLQLYGPADEALLVPTEVFDALAVMRYAQLATDPEQLGVLEAAVAAECAGNLGADALRQRLGMASIADTIATLLAPDSP